MEWPRSDLQQTDHVGIEVAACQVFNILPHHVITARQSQTDGTELTTVAYLPAHYTASAIHSHSYLLLMYASRDRPRSEPTAQKWGNTINWLQSSLICTAAAYGVTMFTAKHIQHDASTSSHHNHLNCHWLTVSNIAYANLLNSCMTCSSAAIFMYPKAASTAT